MPGWPTRRLTNPDRSGGTGGQAMVRGYARVQLFHAEGNRFTEQRMSLLDVQAERSERLDVGGQMGAAVAYNHGVNLAAWASKDVTRVALHDFARLNAVLLFRHVREPAITILRGASKEYFPAFLNKSTNERRVLAVLKIASFNEEEAVVRSTAEQSDPPPLRVCFHPGAQ